MRSSELNREVTIEHKSVTKHPTYRTDVVEWVPLVALPGSPVVGMRFRANVQDVMPSRNESILNGSLAQARNMTRIRMRWRDDIDSSMRIVVHGDSDVTYQIIGGPAEIMGRKQMIEFMCERFAT